MRQQDDSKARQHGVTGESRRNRACRSLPQVRTRPVFPHLHCRSAYTRLRSLTGRPATRSIGAEEALEAQNRNCLGHSCGPTPGTWATETPSEVTIVIIAWNITTFGKIGPFWEAFLLPTQISHPNGLITKYNLRFFWTPSSHPFIPSMRKRKAPEIARDLRRWMEDAAVRSRSAGQIACGAAWSAARSQPPGFRPTARN